MWVRILSPLILFIGAYDSVVTQLVPKEQAEKFPKIYSVVSMTTGFLPWWGWVLVLAAIFVIATVEYEVRQSRIKSRINLSSPPAQSSVPFPDMPIHDLFFHISADLLENHKECRWQKIGDEIRDKLSTLALDAWARKINPSPQKPSALTPVDAAYWKDAQFTYAFLHEGGKQEEPHSWTMRDGASLNDYADIQFNRAQVSTIWPPSPLEIFFDPSNPGRKFWSIEPMKDETGKQGPGSFWEYRAAIKNKSAKTIRNVNVSVEAIGPMPTRPEHTIFDINKKPLIDLAPSQEALAVIRCWYNPIRVAGMAIGTDIYGPIKMIAHGDDVRPAMKLFHFDPEKTPMIFE
jgi:hypothetical protein